MVMKYPFYKRLVGGYFQKYTLAYFAFWQLILKTKRVEFIAVLFFFVCQLCYYVALLVLVENFAGFFSIIGSWRGDLLALLEEGWLA